MTPSIYSLFVLGAILTCILTPLVRYLALQKGFVDCPQGARRVHQQATPRHGGAAILIDFLFVISIAGVAVPQLKLLLFAVKPDIGAIILGSLGIFGSSFGDDLGHLSPEERVGKGGIVQVIQIRHYAQG